MNLHAQLAFQLLYQFPTNAPGPYNPSTRLLENSDDTFYGTSSRGGMNDLGCIYRLTRDGACTTVFSFGAVNGQYPNGGLVLGQDRNYYGTTASGGDLGMGTVFQMTPAGVVTTLFSFQGTNGSSPTRLEPGRDANLYGVTSGGGTLGLGTVFTISTNGHWTLLFSFQGTNGCNPWGGLVAGADGALYGVTRYGGNGFTDQYTGNGTVFSITTNGAFTSLFAFNGANGAQPIGPLSRGRDGDLYGTTSRGGVNGMGTVFALTAAGALNRLHDFGPAGAVRPFGGVTQGNDGKLYGVTAYSILNGVVTNGTVFSLTSNGMLTPLLALDGTNGVNPFSEMISGSDGNLYGTLADIQGQHSINGGTFFRLVPPPVFSSVGFSSGSAMVTWSAFTNGVYRVERKPAGADANWTPCTPVVTAAGTTASFNDPTPAPSACFYRVVLLP